MGGSSSKSVTTNENNQTIVNKNDINLLNEQLNEVIAKTTINNSAGCRSEVNQNQILDISGCQAQGDLNIQDVSFKQEVVVDFKCIQVSKVQNDIARSLMSSIMAQINSNMDTDSLNKMNSIAKSSASSGFAGFSPSESSTATNNKYNLDVTNDNTTDIQNIIRNVINVELDVNDIQECVNSVVQNQEILARDCNVGGDINISNIKFDQAVNTMTDCLQQKGIANKLTDTIQTGLGVVTTADSDTKAIVDQKAAGGSSAESKGAGSVPGEVVGGVVGGLLPGQTVQTAQPGASPGNTGNTGNNNGQSETNSLGLDNTTTSLILCCCCILLLLLSAGAAFAYYMSLDDDEKPRLSVRRGR